MGESVTEGTISRWLKAVGDRVTEGESLVEVTTDKVDVEVPSPAAGTLESIVAQEGDTVTVGATLATIAAGRQRRGAAAQRAAAGTERGGPPPGSNGSAGATADAVRAPDGARPPPRPRSPPPRSRRRRPRRPGRSNATPLARAPRALSGHVELTSVTGTGPGGLVRAGGRHARPAGTSRGRPRGHRAPAAPAGAGTVELRGPAASLVEYMEQSRDIPTATSFRDRPGDRARRAPARAQPRRCPPRANRSRCRSPTSSATRSPGPPPRCRRCRAHFARTEQGRPARVDSGVHLGLAVDSRRKDGTPLPGGAGDHRRRHAARSPASALSTSASSTAPAPTRWPPTSCAAPRITLTNPGGIGTVASVPRLMPGQGTIVAVGALGYPPEWRDAPEARLRELGVAKVMTMTSTYDHRVIQGAQSGEFLGRIEALLNGENGFYEGVFESLGVGLARGRHPPQQRRDIAGPGGGGAAGAATSAAPSRQMLAAVQAATSLIKAHRTHGHLGAHLDPLGTPPLGDPAMEPETYGLTPDLMEQIPADVLRVYVPGRNLAEVLPNLRRTYCGTIAYEIEHIASHEQRVWLREHIESGAYRMPFSPDQKRRLLQRLTKVEAMERYLRRTFIGQKTFSAEGVDAMVPMLEGLLTEIANDGIGEVVMGMSHRGRLATIAHVVNRPYAAILVAFERGEMRRAVASLNDAPTGDVKYHIGSAGTYLTDSGKGITVRLLSNPSHLEAVDPVVEGWTRAEQTKRSSSTLHVDPMVAVPVLLHGDAAFAGQGIVAEVFNLQSLDGYATGGTVHIITNNQVGFTTEASDARSTRYASDLAKGFDVPIVHVNADDIEACINAVRLAWDYRRTYHRDVVIDLIGYRRFGHNETDEPSYTQPLMYQKIKEHPTAREIYLHNLVAEGLVTEADGANDFETAYSAVAEAHKRVKATLASDPTEESEESTAHETEVPRPSTRVPRDILLTLNEQLVLAPDDFHIYPKLAKQLERRRAAVNDGAGIDWGTAESLAFASLLTEGHPIRLSGQDTQRGTFSQRHLVFHDDRTGAQWIPMQQPGQRRGHVRGLQQPAQRGRLPRLRVRLQRRRPHQHGALGGAVRRLRQQRRDGRRPVHLVGAGQVGTALSPRTAAAPRLRGQRTGALERAPGALPAARGARQHARRQHLDGCAVLPPPARPGHRSDGATAGDHDPQEPAASQGVRVHARRAHRG